MEVSRKKLTDIIHKENIPVITQLALGAYYREKNDRFQQIEPDDMTAEELNNHRLKPVG